MADSFGQRLRGIRVAAGLTQEELASRSGLTDQAIRLLERGERRYPRKATLTLLIEALELDDEAAAKLIALVPKRGAEVPASENPPPAPAAGWKVARELPPVASHFSGREQELEQIRQGLTAAADGSGSAPVVTIQGMAGVGKSALAVAAASELADSFPDGQLYVDLGGFRSGAPLSPEQALHQLLRGTGLTDSEIPSDEAAASALLRSRLAGRQVLILLDNATGADQVTPLLPASASCATLVISRLWLTRLPASGHIQLEVLDDQVALDLLRSVVGTERIDAEPEPSAQLIKSCAGLPLALRIAASRLVARPAWRVQDLVDRLDDQHRRISELTIDDISVRASLAVSFSRGSDETQLPGDLSPTTFAALGLVDLDEVGTAAVAQLVGADPQQVEDDLELLVDAHVLTSPTPGRYRSHALIHLYARELAGTLLTPDLQEQALDRLLDLYEAAAWRATALIEPLSARLYWRPTDLPDGPRLADGAAAMAWLKVEHESIVRLLGQLSTGSPERFGQIGRLIIGLGSYFLASGRFIDQTVLTMLGLRIAPDPSLRTVLRSDLGVALTGTGQFDQALENLLEAADDFRRTGNLRGAAMSLNNAARAMGRCGRFDQAILYAEQALTLNREVDDPYGASISLTNLGTGHCMNGSVEAGRKYFEESLALALRSGSENARALALTNLGCADLDLGRTDDAINSLEQAVELRRNGGMHTSWSDTLFELSKAYLLRGDRDRALETAHEARDLATLTDDAPRLRRIEARINKILDH